LEVRGGGGKGLTGMLVGAMLWCGGGEWGGAGGARSRRGRRGAANERGRRRAGAELWRAALAFSRYLASTMEASHTVVPRLWEEGSWARRRGTLQAQRGGR
jgi:hypothetical protein